MTSTLRDAYAQRLDAMLQELVQFPEMGRARDDIAAGLRGYPAGQHVIYYRADGVSVTIIRVLHQKMDARALFQ